MSPEQAACEPVDGRSDQFALGLVFYEMLTGVRVFNSVGENLDDTLDRVQRAEIPHPQQYVENLPQDVCAMVRKMLRRDKEKRYRDAGMVADACDAYLRLCGCLHSAADLAAYVEELYWQYDSYEG
jgi:serine/threonine-protein kinase